MIFSLNILSFSVYLSRHVSAIKDLDGEIDNYCDQLRKVFGYQNIAPAERKRETIVISDNEADRYQTPKIKLQKRQSYSQRDSAEPGKSSGSKRIATSEREDIKKSRESAPKQDRSKSRQSDSKGKSSRRH